MFTGIVEALGTIEKIEGNRFTISHPFEESFELGESIAVNGVCLTVVSTDKGQHTTYNTFTVEIIEESRNVTTFSDARVGDKVNLERAAIIGQRNSGHNVTGHVDQVGEILNLTKESDYHLIRIRFRPEFAKWIIHKGSIAVEGISLTVSAVGEDWFEVSIISHTWEETNLHLKKEGDGVNVEFDAYAKYVEKQSS